MGVSSSTYDDAAPRLIIINQSVGPAFLDWLIQLAAASGPLALWSDNAPAEVGTGVSVRSFAAYDNSSIASRMATWGRFTLAVTWQLLRQGGRTPLFVVTNPPFMPIVAWWLRALQGRPYGLLEWDIYPQMLAAMGLVSPKNLLYRTWKRGHAGALRTAELVVTIGYDMAVVLQRMAHDAALPVEVVPNWVNTDWLMPLSREDNPFVQEQGLQNRLVVLYSGNLGASHPVETILEVVRLLTDEPRVCFLIIGEGSKRNLVEAVIAQEGASNLRLLPLQPKNRLPYTLSCGHIGIVGLGEGYEGLSMPSKTYSLMAVGNAILGISQPPNDLADTIARYGCGANFRPHELTAIASWICSLLDSPATLARLQEQSRQAAVTTFSMTRCTALLTTAVTAALLNYPPGRMA